MRDAFAALAFFFGTLCTVFNWIGWIRWLRQDCSPAMAEKMMKLLSCFAGAFLLMITCWCIA